jgi:hypothetical protein
MKLKVISIEIGTGLVQCVATWIIQDVENNISFRLVEADLYAKAAIRNDPEWSNQDVCDLATATLGIQVTI